ncbi:MAG: rhodanese-like domain-containing protein [Prochlorococcaceae cyanobacterium ETNP1_MAG_9]|nr:rhodanese-like domain-containing protein [Prochlorococcaceae cyanobacterium ETNP1_MAG_9]
MNQQVPRNISANDLQTWLLKESDQPVLVDVRESQELAISPFPAEVVHLPLSEASAWVKEMPKDLLGKKPVVVICHSGIRSLNFATWLIEQGSLGEVWNLVGGIDAWSVQVDPSVPRY